MENEFLDFKNGYIRTVFEYTDQTRALVSGQGRGDDEPLPWPDTKALVWVLLYSKVRFEGTSGCTESLENRSIAELTIFSSEIE